MLTNFSDTLRASLRDQKVVAIYIKTALEDEGYEGFNSALREVVIANGGFKKLSKLTGRKWKSLNEMLARKAPLPYDLVVAIFQMAGLKIQISPPDRRRRLRSDYKLSYAYRAIYMGQR